jgi:PAS domain S-box-containing protein
MVSNSVAQPDVMAPTPPAGNGRGRWSLEVPGSAVDQVEANILDPRWVMRLLRMGFAVAIVSQTAYLGVNRHYLTPPLAHLALPYGLVGLAASIIAGVLSLRPWFADHWKPVTFGLCISMVACWTGAAATIGQQVQLFVAVVVVMTATCCLIPWGSRWQAMVTAACIVCCAINTWIVTAASPYIAYLWLDVASAAALTLLSSRLWESWRGALTQSNRQLREEVAEREAAQRKLEQSEASLRTMLDANIDPVSVVRLADARYVYVNQAFLDRGFSREEVLGKSAREFKLWGDESTQDSFTETLRKQGFVRNFETEIRLKNGKTVPYLVSSVVTDLTGEPCVLSIARDITELKRSQSDLVATVAELRETQRRLKAEIEERERTIAERERAEILLRNSEAKLRRIFEACPDSICINSMIDGRYIECNSEFFTTGYSKQDLVSASPQTLGVWAKEEQFAALVKALSSKGIVRNMEVDFRLKDGTVRPCLISGAVIELDGEPCAVTITSDITRLKRTERELIAAREAALAASRAKSEFLSSMSHEIRTPMNAILGMAELLAESPLAPVQRRYAATMVSNGNALLDLINGILDLAKVESGKLHLEESEFDLDDVVGRVVETLCVRAHEKKIELATRILPDVPSALVGDPLRLRQVLINLVGNAIKFTEQGEVTLTIENARAQAGGRLLRFSVRDTGVGISPEKLDTVFNSFTQADSSVTRRYGGSGLGLAIARRLVELMGGEIWVESELGKGSTFYFQALLKDAPKADVAAARAAKLANLRVLIVDDNATNRLILREMLVSQGAETGEVGAGEEALVEVDRACAEGHAYDLMLLDCRMPVMDGFEVAERLKRRPADRHPIVLMLTSDYLNPKLGHLRKLGIAAYVVKPVRRSELLATISSVMGKAQTAEEKSVDLDHKDASEIEPRELHILFAEDSPDNRLLISAYLKGLPYQLDVAENGRTAVEKFMHNKYDLVLMDVQMPIMDGHTAVRTIRKWENEQGRPPTPIIALTASALSEDIRDSMEAGCNTHLSKPIKKARLLTAIRDFARPEAAAPQGNGQKIVVEVDEEIKDLIPEFLQRKRDDLSLLITALERVDFEALRSIGHKIKGEGAGFGFQIMSDIGEALEEAARTRNAKSADQQVRALARYLDHVEVRYPPNGGASDRSGAE